MKNDRYSKTASASLPKLTLPYYQNQIKKYRLHPIKQRIFVTNNCKFISYAQSITRIGT